MRRNLLGSTHRFRLLPHRIVRSLQPLTPQNIIRTVVWNSVVMSHFSSTQQFVAPLPSTAQRTWFCRPWPWDHHVVRKQSDTFFFTHATADHNICLALMAHGSPRNQIWSNFHTLEPKLMCIFCFVFKWAPVCSITGHRLERIGH